MTRVCLGSLKSGDNRLGSDDNSPWDRNGAGGFIRVSLVVSGVSSSSSVRSMTPLFSGELNSVEDGVDVIAIFE